MHVGNIGLELELAICMDDERWSSLLASMA